MKLIPIISCLSLCGLAIAEVEEIEIGLPEVAKPHPPIEIHEGFDIKRMPEPETEAIPAKYAEQKELGLYVELQTKLEGGHHSISVRLINPTEQAVHFRGYSEKSPWYRIQRWSDGKWVEHQVGWFCGTGLRSCVIKPGMSSVISVSVKPDMHPLRVGVGYSNKPEGAADKVVWSEKIEN